MTELNGPWQQALYVDLPMRLRSKSNYRRGQKGWDALASFEAVTAAVVRQVKPEDWDLGDPAKPVAKRPTVVLAVAATSLVDSTNFTKSVADALQGVLVHNDASIAASATLCERRREDQRCGVAAALLKPGASLEEQSTALAELVRQLPQLFEAGREDAA